MQNYQMENQRGPTPSKKSHWGRGLLYRVFTYVFMLCLLLLGFQSISCQEKGFTCCFSTWNFIISNKTKRNLTWDFFLGDIVVQITMLSFGKSLLYAEFLPRKKLQDRMPLSLIDLVTTVGKVTLPSTESNITFSISCTDANDEDVEVPDVVAKVR